MMTFPIFRLLTLLPRWNQRLPPPRRYPDPMKLVLTNPGPIFPDPTNLGRMNPGPMFPDPRNPRPNQVASPPPLQTKNCLGRLRHPRLERQGREGRLVQQRLTVNSHDRSLRLSQFRLRAWMVGAVQLATQRTGNSLGHCRSHCSHPALMESAVRPANRPATVRCRERHPLYCWHPASRASEVRLASRSRTTG